MILSGIPQSTTSFGGESTSTRSFTTYTTRNGTIITSILLSTVTIIPTNPPITHGPASVASSISTTTASPIPPIHGTAAESMSHESGHSTPLIAATATASALFLLIIVAGVWLYMKCTRCRKQNEGGADSFPQSSKFIVIIMYTNYHQQHINSPPHEIHRCPSHNRV